MNRKAWQVVLGKFNSVRAFQSPCLAISDDAVNLIFRVKQAQTLIIVITINFVNFMLYSSQKIYLLFFVPVDCGGYKSKPAFFSDFLHDFQVHNSVLTLTLAWNWTRKETKQWFSATSGDCMLAQRLIKRCLTAKRFQLTFPKLETVTFTFSMPIFMVITFRHVRFFSETSPRFSTSSSSSGRTRPSEKCSSKHFHRCKSCSPQREKIKVWIQV